jgi:hypothetical protein
MNAPTRANTRMPIPRLSAERCENHDCQRQQGMFRRLAQGCCRGARIAAAPCQSSADRGGARLRFASRWDENDSRSGRNPLSTSFSPSGATLPWVAFPFLGLATELVVCRPCLLDNLRLLRRASLLTTYQSRSAVLAFLPNPPWSGPQL